MGRKKIIVAWVCEFSNPLVRGNLTFRSLAFENFVRSQMKKPAKIMADYDQWITNGIEEMKKFENLELHVVSFHKYIKNDVYEFENECVHYHILKPEDDCRFLNNVFRKFLKKEDDKEFKRNRKTIKQTLAAINPDIIHYYGAENPEYSISALDIDSSKTPLIVNLQTLMSAPGFKENYPLPGDSYEFRSGIEKKVIRNATFIGTSSTVYKDIILQNIKPDAVFIKMSLMIAERINVIKCEKKYDFVYFSADISKAADLAIEAFIITSSERKGTTLCVIGDYMPEFKAKLEKRLAEHNLVDNVTFTGRLATHDDVLEGVRKARFALLPLKVDLVSGTIREAMASGLPVVTTKTAGTPSLNQNRESVLVSEIGDNKALSDNMLKLLDDDAFAKKLAENALVTYKEKYDNSSRAADLMKIYEAIYNKDYKSVIW